MLNTVIYKGFFNRRANSGFEILMHLLWA